MTVTRFTPSSKMFTDHQPLTLKLDNKETKNLTLEKLAALTVDPRCIVHVKEKANLCCSSCGNVPVCIICIYSKHKGHDLHDVTELAKGERELLKPKLAELNMYRAKLYELPKKVGIAAQTLKENIDEKTEKFMNQHKQQTHKIKEKLAKRTKERKRGILEIENRRKDENKQTSLNFEKELSQLKEKYDKIRERTENKYDKECEEFNVKCDEKDGAFLEKLRSLDVSFKNLTTANGLLAKPYEEELRQRSDYCDQIIKRYENFTATTTSVLASNDVWKDVQCIPDIRAACDTLIEEMKHDFPELKSLSDFKINQES
ncbi:hypothetical protein BSL78_24292 [Apostichopus japonicus]|uniref:B box-type domain-containing protein n=1 Tax=Stichopus japonicus TaxID=307972 RepID=A0A2G8JSW4_STIJA|nr:hypothetical protein BSL78_24292 [Apostichopus japonicus]